MPTAKIAYQCNVCKIYYDTPEEARDCEENEGLVFSLEEQVLVDLAKVYWIRSFHQKPILGKIVQIHRRRQGDKFFVFYDVETENEDVLKNLTRFCIASKGDPDATA